MKMKITNKDNDGNESISFETENVSRIIAFNNSIVYTISGGGFTSTSSLSLDDHQSLIVCRDEQKD